MNKLTTRDIAKLAGVSPTAVSFALNNKPGISDETRRHIWDIIEKTDYRPTSRTPATREPLHFNRIAVIFRNDIRPIDRLFYTELNTSVMLACSDSGYDMVFTYPVVKDGNVLLPEIIRTRSVDGVLVYGDTNPEIIRQLHEMNLPVVELDSSRTYPGQIAVSSDYRTAAYTAVRHLISLGHKDIAYIGNDELHDFNVLTFGGFQQAATEAGLSLDLSRIQINICDESSLHTAVDGIISGGSLPTAFFCATDLYAVHVMQRLHAAGIRMPDDVSVIGIDDTIISRFTIPALTTVRIDREELGKIGFELLSALIEGEHRESVTLPSADLIVRESTAPPSR